MRDNQMCILGMGVDKEKREDYIASVPSDTSLKILQSVSALL